MDTITHTLFGLTMYAAIDKRNCSPHEKRALFVTAVGGSQIPDIDIVSALWDTGGRYQMWHRGLTHSVFLVPVWAALLVALNWLLFKVGGWRLFGLGVLAVLIHDTSDLFNAWGTGYLEPFSPMRITFGTIPIVDFMLWAIMIGGLLYVKLRKPLKAYRVYRIVGLLLLCHFLVQSLQGYVLHQQYGSQYDQLALSAGFIPGQFQLIGKKDGKVEISAATVFTQPKLQATLESKDQTDLSLLFAKNPKARTLHEWAPFVVIVDDGKQLAIYDPRFYRKGQQSFLYEFMDK
ncbi:metal-dependent hydrolase [Paenibacillus agricola]|uniref:Metal-dependent hydrolase n=1 Tax=Paenibacillus agricola TaxID=2716264 RepID=A0ABX0J5J7_9BACL|nr:metal-dependent hydrolase [Paenibacillus agricola]NHN29366.1 metal-dependent hydrolase [Paenibacillus agricola]